MLRGDLNRNNPAAPGAAGLLLEAARGGDENAYRRLVEPHSRELHAHAYRMLGSVHDAEDAIQDALLRAWRGLPRFDGRSSLRSWLYKIATNTCLDTIAGRGTARPADRPRRGRRARGGTGAAADRVRLGRAVLG